MHRLTRLAATCGLVALAVTGSAATARVSAATAPVVGHVYVDDNTGGTNTVAGFDRHADGTLTPLAGSPFAVGGTGTMTITGSQGALQTAADGRFLLAVDAGSNQISVLRILPNGALYPVEGSPFPSGGNEPVSIAVHGRLVYVANTGNGGANYTGFILGPEGRLRPLYNSTVPLPDGSGPGDVLFSPNGTHLVGVRVGTSLIDSFAVSPSGRLTPAPGSPFASPVAGPFGSEFRPTNGGQLFVTNAHGGTGNGSVSAYDVTADGILSPIGASPYPDFQTAPCWVEISHDGRYLFANNTGSASISAYSIAPDGSLTLGASTPLNGGTALKSFDLRLSPDGAFLYVVDAGADAVSILAVSGGALTEQQGSPVALPAGATPFGIVVD